jgi:hypothetical protein
VEDPVGEQLELVLRQTLATCSRTQAFLLNTMRKK